MFYLTGAHNPQTAAVGLGLITQPGTYGLDKIREYKVWAADNGCFTQTGKPFDESAWWRWIWQVRRAAHTSSSFCLFATAPDVVGDAQATFKRGWTKLHHLRNHGMPAAFVAQDGLETMSMVRRATFWDEFDSLFIGGSTEWKLGPGAAWLAGEARARRKWVHMGRVNSEKRLLHADRIGCQSVDGTFLAFGPDQNLKRLKGWLWRLENAQQLELIAA